MYSFVYMILDSWNDPCTGPKQVRYDQLVALLYQFWEEETLDDRFHLPVHTCTQCTQ
eukprot:SAG11_NODE_218_length_12212_cov_7.026005_16_plen_57_part_00